MIASAHSFFCQRVPVTLTTLITFTAIMVHSADLALAPTPPQPAAVRATLVDPEVSSILWTQVNGVVKRKRETYATNTQTV
jgi:hypothetical protein